MVVRDDIIILNKKEALALADKECRERLHMSTKEFVQRRAEGTLPKSIAVHDIEMMLRLAK